MTRMLSWRQRWPEWIGYVTAAWSLAYGALGAFWAAGGPGFPFGLEHDSGARLSLFALATPETGGPVIAILGVGAAALALGMARARRGERRSGTNQQRRFDAQAFGWSFVVLLLFVVPDFRVLTVVAYAPIILIGAPFDWPQPVRLLDVLPWPVLNQAVCILGGLGWAATTIVYRRRTHDACEHCGRKRGTSSSRTEASAQRWGKWAVAVAVIIPLTYAFTRFAWALGFPLGLTEKLFREGQAVGLWWRGAALATLAVVGAVLTVGLIRPWGEVFPRWVPFTAGKRVPRAMVIVPAVLVSVIVTSAGLMFVRMSVAGTFRLGDNPVTFTENFGALLPELLWPIWGIALAAATLAYHYRTRQRCRYCGRG